MKRYWYFIMWLWNKIPIINPVLKLLKGLIIMLFYTVAMFGMIAGMLVTEHRALFWTICGVSTFCLLMQLLGWPALKRQWEKYNEESDQIFNTLRK